MNIGQPVVKFRGKNDEADAARRRGASFAGVLDASFLFPGCFCGPCIAGVRVAYADSIQRRLPC